MVNVYKTQQVKLCLTSGTEETWDPVVRVQSLLKRGNLRGEFTTGGNLKPWLNTINSVKLPLVNYKLLANTYWKKVQICKLVAIILKGGLG